MAKSFIFPLPVSGETIIEIYSDLYYAARDRNISCDPRISIASNLHYFVRKEVNEQISPLFNIKIEPVIDERIVDFYYGYNIHELEPRYLVVQNPDSENWFARLIFIPKDMDKELWTIYSMIYANVPFNFKNKVMLLNPCSFSA